MDIVGSTPVRGIEEAKVRCAYHLGTPLPLSAQALIDVRAQGTREYQHMGWVCDSCRKGLKGYIRSCMHNPGAPESVEIGCSCPVIDNEYGRGYRYVPGRPRQFIYSLSCRVHYG